MFLSLKLVTYEKMGGVGIASNIRYLYEAVVISFLLSFLRPPSSKISAVTTVTSDPLCCCIANKVNWCCTWISLYLSGSRNHLGVRHWIRKIILIESNAKMSSSKKSYMERDFASGVYLSEAPPLLGFCLGVAEQYLYSVFSSKKCLYTRSHKMLF